MPDDPAIAALAALVARAAKSDQAAWDEIVERYAPLVLKICNRYRLSNHDIEDVGQSVWLRLLENIGNLRVPAALPGWLATTTQRQCLSALRQHQRWTPLPDEMPPGPDDPEIEQMIVEAELNAALRAAFSELQPKCREVLSMLISDPPHSYAEISRTLGRPIGSIGPCRKRCLDYLRDSRHLTAFLDGGGESRA